MSASYIFDVEGTLIDCARDILRCWSETLAAFGIAVPSADLQLMSGMDGDEMLAILVPRLDARARKKILTAQGERYRSIYLPRARAFPGVRAVFSAIKSQRPHRAGDGLPKRRVETLPQPDQRRRSDRRDRVWR
jgi:phosphoglycolate phosphatase-like HAD superfamily hydrolase